VDLAVGFDLDMTLVDSRAGIIATAQAAVAEHGGAAPADELGALIGIPLDDMLAPFVPAHRLAAAAERYRELYPTLGVPHSAPLPGAVESLQQVRALHGRVVVVSAKPATAVRLVLERAGLEPDVVVGGLFGADKGLALREHGVTVYVGDHPGDMVGAAAAGAQGVGVPTGPNGADALRAAGASVVLDDLTGFAAWLDGHVLQRRLVDLEQRLRGIESLMVAFSGGADSAFLLAAAVRALGPERVVAATAVSSSLATGELDGARAFAEGLGVRHLTPTTDEMSREGYRANAGDRCFFCKAELLDVLAPLAEQLSVTAIATGTNADDALAGFRPGIRAAAERGALTPLRDSGFTKAQVRSASALWQLPTWDKPAAACLSSRIAYGVQITPSGLARVDRAELAAREWFAGAGIEVRDLRVRDLGGERGRVEVDVEALSRLDGRSVELAAAVGASGFAAVEIDPQGFRSGSMNELLATPERYR
jgi:pyridinium-3,5-biscarboxylic acid mononucleotide sulfurtransferase